MPSVIIGKVKGDKGEAGISPIVTLEKNENLLSISVTDAEGTKTESIDTNEAVQSDWNTTDTALNSYIKNKPEIPSKVSQLKNDSGYLTSYTETDPTVPTWAKSATKPEYTATEVGALPSDTTHVSGDVPITRKINGKTLNADITLSANDVGALSNTTTIPNSLSDFRVTATADEVNVLDGITVTTTELNYVDGVVSNIQTQLDAKSPSTHNHDERYYTENEIDTKISNINDSISSHTESTSNPHHVTKSQVGLGNVENKSSATIRGELTKSNITTALGYTPYTPNEVDNKFSALETNIDWKESVETYSDIATTYPSPVDGWTVNVKDTDYTYRYNGTSWVAISANAIPKATNSVDGLLSKEDHTNYDDANSKKHTHSNKSVLDGISSTNVSNWNSAKTHADSAHAPSNAQANVIETIKVNGTALTPSSKAVDITIPSVGNGTITITQNGTSKGSFTTNQSGNTTIALTDNNTTYSAGTGLSLSGTTFSNSGVRSIVSGSTNGTISVNTNGTSAEVAVKGLGSAAYTESSAYLSSSGGTVKGTLTIDKSGTSSSTPILSLGNSSGKVMTYIYLSSGHPQVAGVWEATNLYEGGKSLADKYQTKVHEVISSSEPTSQVSGDYWLEDY